MPVQSLKLNVPDAIYHRLEQRAQQAKRTVEAELLDVLAAAMPAEDELPRELADAVKGLAALDDNALKRVACDRLPAGATHQLEQLHLKRRREELTPAETEVLSNLVRQYERAMLVRAQASALLHQRGHDLKALASMP